MGLDVSVYSKLEEVSKEIGFYEDGEVKDGFICLYNNDSFEGRILPQKDNVAYRYDHNADGVDISMGYGRYNVWRNQLAVMAGYGSGEDAFNADSGDFWELINFSDCEGTIGTDAAKKLLADFEKHQQKADVIGGFFLDMYNEFKKACEIASDNGAIVFH